MAKPTYASLVKQGLQAAKSQWTLGDLASKVETHYGEESLQQYADDIGVEYNALKGYRTVARAYELGTRIPDVAWSVHRILAGQDDRTELIQDTELTAAAARGIVRGRKEASAVPEMPPIEEETWLGRAVEYLRPVLKERTGVSLPEQVRTSIGWPLQKGKGTDTIGQAWHGAHDGVPQVYISPQIGEATRVLDVLTHELLHVGLPPGTSHKRPFKVAAGKVGLDGPATETFAGPQLAVVLKDIAEELGPYPHSPIDPPQRKVKTKARDGEPTTIKYVCVDCRAMDANGEGYTCRVTVPRGLLADHGWPRIKCPVDDKDMETLDDE